MTIDSLSSTPVVQLQLRGVRSADGFYFDMVVVTPLCILLVSVL